MDSLCRFYDSSQQSSPKHQIDPRIAQNTHWQSFQRPLQIHLPYPLLPEHRNNEVRSHQFQLKEVCSFFQNQGPEHD